VSHFAIIVTIKLKPGRADDFRPVILENAAAARRDEPGCRRFDVLVAEDDGETFFFYEEYEDAAALEAHRAPPHYMKYWQAAEDMIVERAIQRCSVIG